MLLCFVNWAFGNEERMSFHCITFLDFQGHACQFYCYGLSALVALGNGHSLTCRCPSKFPSLFFSYTDFRGSYSDRRTRTFGNVRRYCTVYFKSMKFIVLMLLATEHRFITSGKCLFQNSFNGPYVHSVISRLLFWHQLAAMISEHISQGAFYCVVHSQSSLSCWFPDFDVSKV